MSDVLLPDSVDRWETSGGTWRVLSVQGSSEQGASATVELLRCDGGEVVESLTLREAQDVSWARMQLGDQNSGDNDVSSEKGASHE